MPPFELWLLLGLCFNYVPDDDELTMALCEMQFQAKHRLVEAINIHTLLRAREIEKTLLTGYTDPYPPLPYRERPKPYYLATRPTGF